MKILAIETSCDETAITLLECKGSLPVPAFKVIANSLLSQIHIHKEYGGVYPMLAKREHEKNLPILLQKTLEEAREDAENPRDIDYIAVTAGPGLEPALWTGITFAEELGKKWGKPVIPVNHMEGHLFSFLFEHSKPVAFPATALLVSGGHTELLEVASFESFKIIGQTRDDAVGEAFDKAARLLGFPYPGGPKISELAKIDRARSPKASEFKLPRPMLSSDDFDFSYSGLKTALLYTLKKMGDPSIETKEKLARAFEDAAIEPLVSKTRRALDESGSQSLIVGGGVSANRHLRESLEKLAQGSNIDLRFPVRELSTDNAIMIGIAAYIRLLTNRIEIPESIVAKGNLKVDSA